MHHTGLHATYRDKQAALYRSQSAERDGWNTRVILKTVRLLQTHSVPNFMRTSPLLGLECVCSKYVISWLYSKG